MVEACSRSVVDGTCAPSLTAPFFGTGWIHWMLLRSGRDANSPSSASCASRPADPEPLIARLPGARKPVAEVIRGRQKRPEQGRAGLVGKVRFVLENRASCVHHVVRVVPVLRPHARRRREQPCGRGQEEETVAQPFPPGRLANAGASTRGRSLREGGLARVLQLGEYGNRKHCVPGGSRTHIRATASPSGDSRQVEPAVHPMRTNFPRSHGECCLSGLVGSPSRSISETPLSASAVSHAATDKSLRCSPPATGAGRQHAAAGALVSCPRQA